MRFRLHPALVLAAGMFLYSSPSHSDQWSDRTPVQYRLRQILIEPSPGADHDNAVLTRAVDILNRVRSGEDFTALAKRYSQEPGADRTGGDLGYFSAGQMVKPFSAAVFSMKRGEIRGPVRTPFGYHIIKLLDIRGKKRHAQHILLTLTPDSADSATTLETLRKIRRQIVRGANFSDMSARYNTLTELRDSEGYMVWQRQEDLLDEFRRAIIGLKPGDVSTPFASILGFHIVLVDSINYNSDVLLQGFPPNIERRLKERSAR